MYEENKNNGSDLYERVLTHVPAQQLHQSYNAVLQEELASANAAVGDVVTAFTKLEEVRGVIAKFEEGHDSTGGRSATLIAAIANTLMVQRDLQQRIDKLVSSVPINVLERKRKRDEDDEQGRQMTGHAHDRELIKERARSINIVQPTVLKRVATTEIKPVMDSTVETSSTSEWESDSDNDDDVEGSEAAWKALIENAVEDKVPSPGKRSAVVDKKKQANQPKTTSSNAANLIMEDVDKLSAEDRAFVIPDVLIALKRSVEEDSTGSCRSEVANSLSILVGWWASESEEQFEHLKLYRDYKAAVESYVNRLSRSKEQQELQSLLDTLSSAIYNLGGLSASGAKTAATNGNSQHATLFSQLVASINGDARREHWLLDVLVAFKKKAACKVQDAPAKHILKPLICVSKWLCERPREPRQLVIYGMLFDATRHVVNRLPGPTRNSVIELVENV
ncbi:hypothetical protein L916_05085 [Phytophthora nicotianae]|uniref:Uncharacterized protein n=1 Tax=Phytophthora nicotianae TaxID=4792 RepID=W2JFY4_PHYNI|nr:hypothetical protein L916_05085 [Phytophthora nicotianae]